ncbi:hypothetical protein P4O66_012795, partial [Electrophorus voltai]
MMPMFNPDSLRATSSVLCVLISARLFYSTPPRILLCFLHVTESTAGTKSTTSRERKAVNAVVGKPSTGHAADPHNWGERRRRILGGPECGAGSDSVESYKPESDYRDWYGEDQYPELDSAWSYDPYMDDQEGYAALGESKEFSDVSFRSDSSTMWGIRSWRWRRSFIRTLPLLWTPRCHREAASSSRKDAPSPKERRPRDRVPTPKPRRGRNEAPTVPAPETGKGAGALPGQFVPKPGEPPPPELQPSRRLEDRLRFLLASSDFLSFR